MMKPFLSREKLEECRESAKNLDPQLDSCFDNFGDDDSSIEPVQVDDDQEIILKAVSPEISRETDTEIFVNDFLGESPSDSP